MPGAFGPILTTGVALSAAVVVVTNPVTAPNADVRIPAAQSQVSMAGGQAVDMLDEDFIEAVGPKPAGSTNPLAILKDLVSALVADATDLGKSAVLRAFIAGASVVSGSQVPPELTAASHPYIVPPAPETLPVLPWTALPGPVPEDLRPVVEQALTAIIVGSGDTVDPGAVAAAFVAGAALAVEESPILVNLRVLLDDHLQPALEDAVVSVVSSLPFPTISEVLRDAVTQYLPSVPSVAVPGLPTPSEHSGGLLATGAPTVGEDTVEVVNRPARPITSSRTAAPLLGIGGVDAAAAEPVTPKRPFSALAAHRAAAPGIVSGIAGDVRSSIGRAVKAHEERTRN